MADFVSHHLFGEQVHSVFPATVQELVRKHPVSFRWGCQGPDPLFYRKILLGSPLHKLGNRMHSEKTDELFTALARGVHCLTGTAQETAAAYFYGFLCHYALDSQIHPYVYCRQEQICSADAKLNASAVHCQIESDIDYLVYERAYHAPVTSFEPEGLYRLPAEEQAVLAVLLGLEAMRVFGVYCCAHWPRPAVWACGGTVLLLCGFGMYIGRFLRLNSWDILHPLALLRRVWVSMGAFQLQVTLLFAGAVFLLWLAYGALRPVDGEKQENKESDALLT